MKKLGIFAIFAIVAGMCLSCGENESANGKGPSGGKKASGCKSCGSLENNSVTVERIV